MTSSPPAATTLLRGPCARYPALCRRAQREYSWCTRRLSLPGPARLLRRPAAWPRRAPGGRHSRAERRRDAPARPGLAGGTPAGPNCRPGRAGPGDPVGAGRRLASGRIRPTAVTAGDPFGAQVVLAVVVPGAVTITAHADLAL